MPRLASLGTWLYFLCTALVFIFMSLRASTGRRARPSRPPQSASAPNPGDAVLATVPSHARLADSLTPASPPASHLRPPPPYGKSRSQKPAYSYQELCRFPTVWDALQSPSGDPSIPEKPGISETMTGVSDLLTVKKPADLGS